MSHLPLHKTRLSAAALSLAALAALTTASRPALAQFTVPAYQFIDLGTINGVYTTATGINDAGQITGVSNNGTDNVAYRIDPITDANGNLVWFQGTGGINSLMKRVSIDSQHPYSESWNINKWGEMAGQALGSGYVLPQNAFFWQTSLLGVQLSTSKSWSWDINDAGSIAGDVFPSRGGTQPTLWRRVNSSFTPTTIPRLTGFSNGYAKALNNSNQVVGYLYADSTSTSHPFVWLPTPAYGLPAGTTLLPTGGGQGWPSAVNDSGYAAGFLYGPGSTGQAAALWSPAPSGGMQVDLLTGAGWSGGDAYGINNPTAGQPLLVVGKAQHALTGQRATIWDASSGLRDLNVLTVNPPQGGLTEARRVNKDGLIVGYFTLTMRDGTKSPTRAFLLVPNATLLAASATPVAPSLLSGTLSSPNQVQLSWTDGSSDENGFRISRSKNGTSFGQIGTVSQDGTSFTDTFEDQSYAPAFRYTYRVSAFNVKGYSSEIIAYITTPGAPLAPNTVAAAGYSGPIRVKLTWKNSSNVQDTVEVERSVTGTGFAPLSAGLSGTATSYEDLSAAAGKTYYYRLRAHTTEGGYSNYSAVVSATTPRR